MYIAFPVVRVYQSYTEPGDGPIATQGPLRGEVNPLHPPAGSEEEALAPLGELTLSTNLGIPIVVVVTKVSLTSPFSIAILLIRKDLLKSCSE